MVTICTASLTFNNSTFCPHTVFMCFVWISEQTAIISLYNLNWLVFITETQCVHSAVRTGFLYNWRSFHSVKFDICFTQIPMFPSQTAVTSSNLQISSAFLWISRKTQTVWTDPTDTDTQAVSKRYSKHHFPNHNKTHPLHSQHQPITAVGQYIVRYLTVTRCTMWTVRTVFTGK